MSDKEDQRAEQEDYAWQLTDGSQAQAMFNGPPGTGKTLSAQVIANELGTPLFKINVATLVDRFVGETEKNRTRVFEEAASDRAILLFDEADSLFSKRVEVKDSTDRYANMQVNLLLQLIEAYDGFVILTTNMKSSIDPAFMPRIAYKLTFDVPGPEERLALWQRHLPRDIVLAADVDLAALAQELRTSGGEIRNAVQRAILSTGGREALGMRVLQRAIRAELEAKGSVVQSEERRPRGLTALRWRRWSRPGPRPAGRTRPRRSRR